MFCISLETHRDNIEHFNTFILTAEGESCAADLAGILGKA